MKPGTIQMLSEALEAIADQFRAQQNGKGEKLVNETESKIQDARIALLKELPRQQPEVY